MEICADELSAGDVLVEHGTVSNTYFDHDEDGTFLVVVVGRDEFTFARDAMVQVRA